MLVEEFCFANNQSQQIEKQNYISLLFKNSLVQSWLPELQNVK